MLAIFEQNEDGFNQWYEKDRNLDLDNKIFTENFHIDRIEQKIKLETENYNNIGIEYDESISSDRQFILEIIKRNLSYANENVTWDFNEEARATLDSKFRNGDIRWFGGLIGSIIFGLLTMVVLNGGWLIIQFIATVGFFLGKFIGKAIIFKNANKKYILEEQYIGYFESILETLEFWTQKHSNVDQNMLRLVLEMALQKFTLALNYQNVKESKKLIRAVKRFKKLLKKKIIQQAMTLSYYIFREFAKENMKFSDGKKITQMIQFVFFSYIDILKINPDKKNQEPDVLTERIIKLLDEKFVSRLMQLHKVKIHYPSEDHLRLKLNIDEYLQNSAAFRNTGFKFSHPLGGVYVRLDTNKEGTVISDLPHSPGLNKSIKGHEYMFEMNKYALEKNAVELGWLNPQFRCKSLPEFEADTYTDMDDNKEIQTCRADKRSFSKRKKSDNFNFKKINSEHVGVFHYKNDSKQIIGSTGENQTKGQIKPLSISRSKDIQENKMMSKNSNESNQQNSKLKKRFKKLHDNKLQKKQTFKQRLNRSFHEIPKPENKKFEELSQKEIDKISEMRPKSVMKGVDRLSYNFQNIPGDIEKIITIYYEDLSDYTLVVDKKDPPLKGYKKLVEGSPIIMVRCDVECKGIRPHECFQLIYDFDIRRTWDKNLPTQEVFETIDDKIDYIYSMFKAPWGVANRDFCQYRRWEYDQKGLEYIIYMLSVDHEKCPTIKDNVRAHTYISGYTVKKHPTDPNSCQMMIISQVDIKGLVPKFIVNGVAASGPSSWASDQIKSAAKCREKNQFKPESYYQKNMNDPA